MVHPYLDSPKAFKIFAHRGLTFREGKRLLDENSLEAFSAALDSGADYLELDVRSSSDGVAVVFHDESLDRVTDQTGLISERSWLELQQISLTGGASICSLEQVLSKFPLAKINIDVKDSRAIPDLAFQIKKFSAEHRVLITSFSEARRRAALARCPGVATSVSASLLLRIKLASILNIGLSRLLSTVDILQIPVSYGPLGFDSPRFIGLVKSHGVQIIFWTINDPGEALRLQQNGADGVVTDRTDLMTSIA